MARTEDLYKSLLAGEAVDITPRSRKEQYLKNCCDKCGCDGLPAPRSREEALLYQLAEQLAGGGGRNPLELLYTEGAEITPQDWGSANLTFGSGHGTALANNSPVILNTKFKKIIFSDTQTRSIGFNAGLLEEYDSGLNMVAHSNSSFMFRDCTKLKKLIMGENFLPFGNYSFGECVSLKEVRYRGTIDKWAEAARNNNADRANPFGGSGGGSFYLGDSTEPITEIHLTTAATIAQGAFLGFKDVTKAHLGTSVESIAASAFYKCTNLQTLILEGDTVKTLSNTNAFNNTPIADSVGTIAIKPVSADETALVAEYMAATNWSTLVNLMIPYSEYVGGAE